MNIKTITENKTVALGIQKGSSLDFVDDVFNALTYGVKPVKRLAHISILIFPIKIMTTLN
jgi:hypothetical protein